MTLLIFLTIVQIAGWITAYPICKRWLIKTECASGAGNNEWHNIDALCCFFGICMCLWWGVWLFYIFNEIEGIINNDKGWFQKKSKI